MDETWIYQHADRLYNYARARLSGSEEIQDVIQETFLAAIKSKETFRGESEKLTWLTGILRHKIHDVYRANARKNKYFGDNLESDSDFNPKGGWKNDIADMRSNPEKTIEKNELHGELMDCIDHLPDVLKNAIRLRELDDMTSKEICNLLNITATNLNVILFRARVKLKKCLQGKGINRVE